MAAEKLVHLVPVEGFYIGGVPAIEMDVTEAEAAELLRYYPPAFVIAEKPVKGPAAKPASAGDPTDSTETEE